MDIKWPDSYADIHKIEDGVVLEIVNYGDIDNLFYDYSNRFHIAANRIVTYMLEEPDTRKLDMYFFAVAYLYRHSIELILKAIGFKYITNIDDRKKFVKKTHHNLLKLLEEINPYISDLIEKDEIAYNWLVNYITDISVIDVKSDSFRYPFSIKLDKDLFMIKEYSISKIFEKQTHINLITFANKFEITLKLFDSIYNNNFGGLKKYKEYNPIFIEEGGDFYSQCVVGYRFSEWEHYPYVTAYKESAEHLYELMIEDNKEIDKLFIPMCYLYRNAIELQLKQLIFEECSFSKQNALEIIAKKKHSILSLWNAIESEIIEHAEASEADTTINDVARYIKQLHEVDSSSDKFRYPTNKMMDIHFKRKEKFDLVNVNNFFLELSSFISAVINTISYHNEMKEEMEAEFKSIMGEYYNDSDYYGDW